MIQPRKYKERMALNSLTGIKSSLSNIRSVVALLYLLYLANDKKANINYSYQNDREGISLKKEYVDYISAYLKDNSVESHLVSNPLLTSQIESLYVGITLMFGLGRISFENTSFSMTKERTGGKRYPKSIEFASNMMILDILFQGIDEEQKKSFLVSWLNDIHRQDELELKISTLLNIFIQNNLFKLRDGNNDLYFQTEGIYKSLETNSEVSLESEEKVGPARILNSMLREGLIPWLNLKNSLVSHNKSCSFDIDAYSKILSTSLDIRDIKVETKEITENYNEENEAKEPLQQIYFGTPGSGKSWTIKQKYEQDERKVFRTTFHPDTDYASFVGCYKPVKDEDDDKKIVYEFVPQAFTDAYVAAWNDLEHPYYLIIEEINRGNCAQIFGDLFQLLDRDKDGYSEYPIKADHDLKDYLEEHLPENNEGIKDGKLCLPPNLSIIASMNTSDQSLFPMDSAFKRRWSWEYVPIDYENAESGKFEITIGDDSHNWHKFLKAVNEKIKNVTSSEDKQMGNFFIKSSIDEKEFCDKVMFYLWSEIGKDNYNTKDAIFKYYEEEDKQKEFSFNELYDLSKRSEILKGFISYIEEEK